jgi:nicotinamidase-related amidase
MPSDLRLDPKKTLLFVVDVQEKLFGVMHPELKETLLQNVKRLGSASDLLGLPAIVTEQYPQGLGPSIAAVKEGFAKVAPIAKTSFDALGDPQVQDRLQSMADPSWSVLVAGMEAHICVYQTVRSLADRGFMVHVLADAIASRTKENHQIALELIRRAGGVVSSTETVLFDLVGGAGSEAFKPISRLVK